MSDTAVAEFTRLVDALVKQESPIDIATLSKLAGEIVKTFNVKDDEVAILTTTADEKFLQFVVPIALQKIGTIPVTSTASLAARTAREKRPELINNFTTSRHSTVFEAVPLEQKHRGDPIQKIMSVPVLHESKMAGVVQVSRKGKSVTSAGPDFSPRELTELAGYATQVGRCFKFLVLE
jgi:GAF domain-containing protein